MRFFGGALARLAPFYGKFNLASELGIHFQAYGLLGAGAGMFHHESLNVCASSGTAKCTEFLKSDAVKPAGMLGAGMRFYFNDKWSLRAEFRAHLFPDSYKTGLDLTQPQSTGTDANYLGILTTLALGVSTLF